MTWHQDPSSMTNPGPSRKDLRRKRANYCRKSVKHKFMRIGGLVRHGQPSMEPRPVSNRRIIAVFRGGAICLFRTHFLGRSDGFFHGFNGLRRLWSESP